MGGVAAPTADETFLWLGIKIFNYCLKKCRRVDTSLQLAYPSQPPAALYFLFFYSFLFPILFFDRSTAQKRFAQSANCTLAPTGQQVKRRESIDAELFAVSALYSVHTYSTYIQAYIEVYM